MADEFYGKGIKVASGFDLGAKSPLDTRSIVNTIEERNAHVTGNRAYIGMKVYVLENAKEYVYNGTNWDEFGGISDEELVQLTVAYQHSQTEHVTEDDLSRYQVVTDITLETTNKTIVGAINEINTKINSIATESDIDEIIDEMFNNL